MISDLGMARPTGRQARESPAGLGQPSRRRGQPGALEVPLETPGLDEPERPGNRRHRQESGPRPDPPLAHRRPLAGRQPRRPIPAAPSLGTGRRPPAGQYESALMTSPPLRLDSAW